MLRPHGYTQVFGSGPLAEADTCQCGHCSGHVFVKPGTASTVYLIHHRDGRTTEEPGAFCRVCMSHICLKCHDVGRCVPFEKQIEQWEARDRLRRTVGV